MSKNLKLYEVNARVWIRRFGSVASVSQIPDDYLKDLKKKGIDIFWLMGAWKTCTTLIDRCCFESDLISSYSKALDDWTKDDVIGSPFSIDTYELNPVFGDENDLLVFKEKLNRLGIKLMLDFVPNHFGADTQLLDSVPELFLMGDEELMKRDAYTFFKPDRLPDRIFAHGRDPLFPPWKDTIQVNYFNMKAREYLTDLILRLSDLCDGLRCDMAMLPLNNVFHNTWVGVLNKFGIEKFSSEFWETAIKSVKDKRSDFIFLAEAYWDLEYYLQQLGFDYTYDKVLTDRLASSDVNSIRLHLEADMIYQEKSARFIENHDEERAVSKFGKQRSLAAAVVMSTVPGLRFYHDGQFEGRKVKLPVQLGREPDERTSLTVSRFYSKLLEITEYQSLRSGKWIALDPFSAGGDNQSFVNMLAWEWSLKNERIIIVVNYSDKTSQCRLRFAVDHVHDEINMIDLLTDEKYNRKVRDIINNGLFIELKSYHSHIFKIVNPPNKD